MKKIVLSFLPMIVAGFVATAQTFVSTTPSNKNVLVEEFTGVNCQYCPDGHKIVNQLITNNPGRVFGINIHAGVFAANTFTTTAGEQLRANWNVTSYPAGMVNRTKFGSSSTPVLNRGAFASSANTILNQPSCANIAARCTIDCATRIMTVNVELFYTDSSNTSTNFISVALLQDNVLGPQVSSSLNPSQIVGSLYNHQHMFRAFVNGSTWGDTVYTTDSGAFVSRTYTYTIPATISNVPIVYSDLKVIAFVSETKADVITACEASMNFVNGDLTPTALTEMPTTSCDLEFPTYVSLFNYGNDTITSFELTYGTTTTGSATYTRSGLQIAPMASDTMHLPTIAGNFASATDYTGFATVTSVNGQPTIGDSALCTLNKISAPAVGDTLTLLLTTDRYGSETTFKFKASNGRIIASGGPYTNSSQTYTIKLPVPSNGCYRVEVYDSGGDGINSGYGNGHFSVTDNNGTVATHDGRFGSQATIFLNSTRGASINGASTTDFAIYPNPVKNTLFIDCQQQIEKVEIFDMQGKSVAKMQGAKNVDVAGLNKGSYILRVTTSEGVSARSFVKE